MGFGGDLAYSTIEASVRFVGNVSLSTPLRNDPIEVSRSMDVGSEAVETKLQSCRSRPRQVN